MTRFLTTTALAVAIAAPAAADVDMLRDQLDTRLDTLAPEVQISELSNNQVQALYAALSAESSRADRIAIVESIVSDSQYSMEDDMDSYMGYSASNSIRDAVAMMLENENADVDVDTLTDQQVSALYVELTSGEATDATSIEAIVN